VSHRSIEILIGRLVTDEAFRVAYVRDPTATLERFVAVGYELTPLEFAALTATNADVWVSVAEQVDPRLQKACLGGEQDGEGRR
jgi:hypothetical protein